MKNHNNCDLGKKTSNTKIFNDKQLMNNSSMSKGQFFILKDKDQDIHFYAYTYTYLQTRKYFHL